MSLRLQILLGIALIEATVWISRGPLDELSPAAAPLLALALALLLGAYLARPLRAIVHRRDEAIERHQALLDASLDAVVVTDGQGRVSEFNRAAERMFRFSREQLLGHPLSDQLFPPECRETVEENLRRLRQGAPLDSHRLELNARRADGSRFPAIVAFSGGGARVTLFLRDISERKQTELGLRKLSTAVEQSPLSIVITDLDGRIEYANPRFTEVTGYTLEEAIGENPRILKSGHNPPELYEELWNTITGGAIWHGELLNRKREGELYWEKAAIGPVRDESGETTHYLAIKEDISERKGMIDEIRHAKEEAESANHAKSEFLATMSHEIRTPMNAILGMGELLAETALDDEQHQYLDILNRGGRNLLELIDDILDLSRIEANRLELNPEPFDLNDLIHGVTQVLGVRAREKGLSLEAEISAATPRYLIGDPKRLRQVLVNLVGNAIKFTHQGSITVRVSPFSDTDPLMLQFAVEDSGIGIAEEKLVTIFDPFTQADGSVTRDYGGTGLGLSISTKLAELMGGCLWVDSEAGRGSTFAFTATFTRPHEEVVSDLEGIDFSDRTIALISGQESTHELFRETLAPLGARLEVIREGDLPPELAERAAADAGRWAVLVIEHLDPRVDGFAFVERLRELEHGKRPLPMVMISPLRRQADLERARELHLLMLPPSLESRQLVKTLAATLADLARPRAGEGGEVRPEREGRYILLAEDSADNALLIETHLKRAGHRLRLARNGREAVDAFREERFELILMDIQMPVMDGYSATRAIREREHEAALHPTPIVALTAHALKEDEEKSLAAGCDGHLTKPVKKRELLEVVERFAREVEESAPA